MTRRPPIADWPERDRALWAKGVEPKGLFEGGGPGAEELLPKVGEGVNRGRRHIVGVFEPPLLHRRSDMPCPAITLSN